MNENKIEYPNNINTNLKIEEYEFQEGDIPVNEIITEKKPNNEDITKIKEYIELKQKEIEDQIKSILSKDMMDEIYKCFETIDIEIPEKIANNTHYYMDHSFDPEKDSAYAKLAAELDHLLNPLITKQAELAKAKQEAGLELSSRDKGYIDYDRLLFITHIEDLPKIYIIFSADFSSSDFGKYAQGIMERINIDETKKKSTT